jgi:hypothetical protein
MDATLNHISGNRTLCGGYSGMQDPGKDDGERQFECESHGSGRSQITLVFRKDSERGEHGS